MNVWTSFINSFNRPPSHSRAIVEIVASTALWGFAFVTAKLGLEGFEVYSFTATRFLLATLITLPFLFRQRALAWAEMKKWFWPSTLLGAVVSAGVTAQTVALQYTSIANTSFIVTLYVVLVPLAESLFFGRKVSRWEWVALPLGIAGTALVSDWGPNTRFNRGDLLCLVAAVSYTLHIVYMSRISPKVRSLLAFNWTHGIAASAVPALMAAYLGTWAQAPTQWTQASAVSIASLIYLVLGPSTLGFLLQVRAQQTLSSTLTAILFLLEGPLAVAFANTLLGETLTPHQALGGLMILAGSVLASLPISLPAKGK